MTDSNRRQQQLEKATQSNEDSTQQNIKEINI